MTYKNITLSDSAKFCLTMTSTDPIRLASIFVMVFCAVILLRLASLPLLTRIAQARRRAKNRVRRWVRRRFAGRRAERGDASADTRALHQRNIALAWQAIEDMRSLTKTGAELRKELFGRMWRLHPNVFEEFLLNLIAERGLRVRRNERYSNDGGIDGAFFLPDGDLVLVQAKRYTAGRFVNRSDLTEFDEACQQQAASGVFVHTGRTPRSWAYSSPGMQIVSGRSLIALVLGEPVLLFQTIRLPAALSDRDAA